MDPNTTQVIFIIACFAFALMIILQRDQIPQAGKKPLAITAIVLVVIAFAVMIASFFQ